MPTGAEDVDELTHHFTLKGPCLAWAMLQGQKLYGSDPLDPQPVSMRSKCIENRHGRLAPGWYGVLLGKSTDGVTRAQYDEVAAKLPGMPMPPWGSAALNAKMGCVVGVVEISHSLPYELCKHSEWASGPVCNIISNAGWISEAVPCCGNLGAAPFKDRATLNRVRELATQAKRDGGILPTGGDRQFPRKQPEVSAASRKRKVK